MRIERCPSQSSVIRQIVRTWHCSDGDPAMSLRLYHASLFMGVLFIGVSTVLDRHNFSLGPVWLTAG